MPVIAVALGSNVGDPVENVRRAVASLAARVRITGASCLYRTAPMYVVDQPPFVNAAVRAETALSPRAVLALLKETERTLGREARPRYGPREIDLDLVAYGALSYRYEARGQTILQVPHPRTPERRFVLQPLFDLDPGMNLPGLGTVADLLTQTNDQAGSVERLSDAVFPI